jgi:hypothetical protein
MPIRWFATDRSVPGVSSTEFRAAVERAFKTWTDVPTCVDAVRVWRTTALEPDQDDDLSVLGFQNHPEMDRVLAATSFDFNDDTGELIEADIFFNSSFEWSTAVGGDAARFDLSRWPSTRSATSWASGIRPSVRPSCGRKAGAAFSDRAP